MKKVLFVDDEPFVRAAFKSIVKWSENGFEITAEASNGAEALELMKQIPFDIVITDIKMPVMDGIILIREIRKANYKVGIIVLSAFNEYELVREAFLMGASDYFLKAVTNPEEIIAILNKVSFKLDEDMNREDEHEKLKNELVEAKNLIKLRFVSDLIWGGLNDSSEISDKYDKLGFNVDFNNIVMAVSENSSGLNELITGYIKDLWKGTGYELFRFPAEKYVLLINCTDDVSFRSIERDLNTIVKYAGTVGQPDIRFGVSNINFSFETLNIAYAQAARASSYVFLNSGRQVFLYKDYSHIEHDRYSWGYSYRTSVKKYLQDGDMRGLRKYLEQIKKDIVNNLCADMDLIKQFYYWISAMLTDIMAEINVPAKDDYFLSLLSNAKGFEDYHNIVMDMIKEIAGAVDSNNNMASQFRQKVIRYVEENYNKDISLTDAASHMGFNESYFSRIFSKELGKSFINYITDIRMRKAKYLLTNTDKMIYEVAEAVGYENSEYFNRIFKRVEGCTPKEFKKRVND